MRFLLIIFLAGLATGCASYQSKVNDAREALKVGNTAKAVTDLEPLANKENDDQLVYLLDYATALQIQGKYKESEDAFNRAERIADIQDYHSISRVASSLVLNEGMVQYKGDDFEKVMINAINAINYLDAGNLDDALVEVRKLNAKLYKYKIEAKRPYEQNPFAFYLSAVIWEAGHNWDDSYIAYKQAYELIPNFAPLKQDLIRAAMRAQRPEELAEWKKKFPDVKIAPIDKSMGEIIFVLEQGWGPRKQPRPGNPRFPHLVPYHTRVQAARVEVDGVTRGETDRVFNVQDVAIKTLDDDFARLVAMRVAGVATKAVLADQLRQQNGALGLIAWVALNAADQADLRQWSTLPQTLQIARVPIKAGHYKFKAIGIDGAGNNSGDQMPEREITVKPGEKTFLSWRSLR